VLAYPIVAEPNGEDCEIHNTRFTGLRKNDVTKLFDLEKKLYNALADEVSAAAANGKRGIFFADTFNATSGNTICKTDGTEFINKANFDLWRGVADKQNHDFKVGGRAESVHPNSEGYSAIGEMLRNYLNSSSFNFDSEKEYRHPDGKQVICEEGESTRTIEIDTLDPNGKPIKLRQCEIITITTTRSAAGGQMTVSMHSTPTVLGTFTADQVGNASTVVTIPYWIEPGDHHLVITGHTAEGEPFAWSAPVELHEQTQSTNHWWIIGIGTLILLAAGAVGWRILSQRHQPQERN
jgi:hypothetical protein